MSLITTKSVIPVVIVCACVLVTLSGVMRAAHGDIMEMPGVGEFDLNYPGWSDDHNTVIEVSSNTAIYAISYYYKMHEHWPATWSDVVAEGIVQTPLYGWKMEQIDLDDPSLDFLGDLYYDCSPVQDGRNPFIRIMINFDGIYIDHKECSKPNRSYAAVFADLDKDFFNGRETFAHQFENLDAQIRLFAIIGMVQKQLVAFFTIKGNYPQTWQQFIDSGLAPIDESSINPVTGSRIYGDGRASDIYYKYVPDYGGRPTFELYHTNSDGSLPDVWFSY